MTPQTVNAYYHPLKNEIVFPAAILQPPFFNEHADDAVNYGGIGAVIGHEIGHGFDDQGSTCDGDGALRDWWTEADRAAFEERTGALIGQYDALSPDRGAGLARERQADHRGEHRRSRRSVHRAARRTGSPAATRRPSRSTATPTSSGCSCPGARSGSRSRGRRLIKQRLATDPHSPDEFRCNQIVRNVDDFYAAFGVTEDDELWLEPEERVAIW